MTVHQLTRSMPASELSEWIAFARLEPLGGQVDDIRAALPVLTLTNVVRRMFGGDDVDLMQLHDVLPWMPRPQPVVLHTPDAPDYDAEKHADALRKLLMSAGNNTRH